MPLSEDQIRSLLGMISSSEADKLDCGGCYNHLAEFAEATLTGKEIPDALKSIETHLEQCPCCNDEFSALIEGLRAIDDD